jgi:signal transduction histidine kinase
MAAQTSSALTPKELSSKPPLQRFLTPRAASRDEAFRERVLRAVILVQVVVVALSMIFAFLAFRPAWGIVSFPTLHLYTLTGYALAIYVLSKGRLLASAWVMIFTALLASMMLVMLGHGTPEGQTIFSGLPAFLALPVLAGLVLPQRSIMPLTLIAALAYAAADASVLLTYPENTAAPENLLQKIGTVLIALAAIGLLMRLMRVEFDDRFTALSKAIEDAEAAKEQAERDRQRAEAADRSKSQFLANMSHEVRTPLNAIIGYNDAMLLGYVGKFEPKQIELLQNIQNNSRRLLNLINDILDLSKIESGAMQVYIAPMSPRKVISETVESLGALADRKQIGLSVTFEDNVPELVMSDAGRIQQIVTNLVSNAIKFTDEGSVAVIVAPAPNDSWRITVRDTGIGMPEDAIEYIFNPFQQVDGSATRKHQGTGLGLAITRRLVENLEGRIEVETELGRGSTFSVTLPRVLLPDQGQGKRTVLVSEGELMES